MRVISLVPSLTETLIECGINVVGRTRFCIHPSDRVASIAVVGGTKGVNWATCESLNPDLVIFDKEENLKQMAEQCPYAWHATHIQSIDSAAAEFHKLALVLESEKLLNHARSWQHACQLKPNKLLDWSQVPGLLKPLHQAEHDYKRIEYIIWRDPWMAVGHNTFIASMLDKMGFADYLANHAKPYPVVSDSDMQRDDTFYLFSSEPYRFLRYHQDLLEQGFHGAIVDGEVYSWFGIRSLKALTQHFQTQ